MQDGGVMLTKKAQQWISVEDRLPARGYAVLCYGCGAIVGAKARDVREAIYTNIHGKPEFLQPADFYPFKWVTHWMYKPEPPKGE